MSGERADAVIVWATLDKSKSRTAIKPFVAERGRAARPGRRLRENCV
ncbi:hypothetical protein [Amycolatopsis sp. NPDC004169]